MINDKLKAIAKLINKDDIVIDIACDHAYLAIYLKKNNLCKEVYASDISINALEGAKKNINKANLNITTYVADGFRGIDNKNINTAVISGVGGTTILNIVKNAPEYINKFIISSNNNYDILRREMADLGYYNEIEIVIEENNKYYPIMRFIRSKRKDNDFLLKYGKSNNIKYYQYLVKKEQEILNKIPSSNKEDIIKHKTEIKNLEKIIKERNEDY